MLLSRLLLALGIFAMPLFAQERVPWTTSRVQGSPEPPAPYRVVRAFPKLRFTAPVDIATIPGTDRIVVVEQRGRLLSIEAGEEGAETAAPFGDLKDFNREATESFAVVFHPRFAENRQAFVWMNLDTRGKPNRENGTHIVRFRVTTEDPPRLDMASGETLLTWLSGGHNGGNLRFGPDGMLYICSGDTASPDPPDPLGTGQDIGDLMSSVLRIDVDRRSPGLPYAIPPDNPFIDRPGARPEVWAYGFRNPWRMAFDARKGDLWVGDVGWELWEMLYLVEKGGNYGWSITEGGKQDVRTDRPRGPTPILPPILAHSHEEAASITGGEVYYGKEFPELEGAYIYGDWQLGTFWSLLADGGRVVQHREMCRSTLLPSAFGVTPRGELLIADHGGGGLWRFERNPDAGKPSRFPQLLSETGLFSDTPAQRPSPGVAPFSVLAPRWADGATAERWIGIPGDARVRLAEKELGVMSKGRWDFPKGTVLAKTYTLETEPGIAASRRNVETQLLHFDGVQWGAYSYRWNDANTDAELVPARGANASFEIRDASAPGGKRQQPWRYFSRAECIRCHSLWNNFSPGFSAIQLDRSKTPSAAELLDFPLPPDEGKLCDPYAAGADLEKRARSYLHANCASCHRYGGGGSVPSMMNAELTLPQMKLVDVPPVQGDLGLPDARLIAPGDPCRSTLLYRMATAGRGHMPYLGGQTLDDAGIALMRDWIASLAAEGGNPSAKRIEQERQSLARFRAGKAEELDSLLATSSGSLTLALALVDRILPKDIATVAATRGSKVPDPMRRDLFERFVPPSERRVVLGPDFDRAAVLANPGDAIRGREIFAALCAVCHRSGLEGRDFGPDLTGIAAKFDRATLLDHIADPGKLIEPQWHLVTATLKSGDPVAGFAISRTAIALVLATPDGQRRELRTADIQSESTSRVSLMPEHLLDGLTPNEAADLLAFLSRPAPPK